MLKFYIAFSIHGTNKFKVATLELKDRSGSVDHLTVATLLGGDFTLAKSRRPGYNAAKDGYKLHWSRLSRKDGTPLQDKGWVTKRFNQLVKMGWTMVDPKPHDR